MGGEKGKARLAARPRRRLAPVVERRFSRHRSPLPEGASIPSKLNSAADSGWPARPGTALQGEGRRDPGPLPFRGLRDGGGSQGRVRAELRRLAHLYYGRDIADFLEEDFEPTATIAALFRRHAKVSLSPCAMESLRRCMALGRETANFERKVGRSRGQPILPRTPALRPERHGTPCSRLSRGGRRRGRRLELENRPPPDVAAFLESRASERRWPTCPATSRASLSWTPELAWSSRPTDRILPAGAEGSTGAEADAVNVAAEPGPAECWSASTAVTSCWTRRGLAWRPRGRAS